jgi:hypothetical protein
VKHFSYITLLLSMAASLSAQTLSFGEITLVTPATTPPSYVVNVILTTAGSQYAGQVAGLQFDLDYTVANFSVATLALGASATTASADLNSTTLPAANVPWITNPPPTPNGPGQRAIIIGCCTGSQTTPTSNIIADGVVATITVQPSAKPTAAGVYTLSLLNPMGTSAGALNTAATAIPLTSTATLDLYPVYLVGGVYPSTSTTAPSFGSGSLGLNDLILELFAVNNIPGYLPACGSDLFDAMDTYPLDTATTRGGQRNGTLNLNDLIVELFRVNKIPGYTVLPVRVSSPYVCGTRSPASAGVTAQARPVREPEVQAALTVGAAESAGAGQDRVPVYIQGQRDLARMGVTFGLGDEQSQLKFQAAGVAPSIVQDSQRGFVAAAWLEGLDIRAGQQVLLGYVVGPSGFATNLKVFGASASALGDLREIGLNVQGASLVRQ